MKYQEQFTHISEALDVIEKVAARKHTTVELVEMACRVRGAFNRLDKLNEQLCGNLKPLLRRHTTLKGEHCIAALTTYQRECFDHKELKDTQPKEVWGPYVYFQEVQSITFKVI